MISTYRIEIKYTLIILALVGGLFALDQANVFSGLNATFDDFFDLMLEAGPVGIFLVAFIGSVSVLIHIPYTVPLLALAMGGASLDNMLVMGIASGLGAGIGETISYHVTLKIFGNNPTLSKSPLLQWVKRRANSSPYVTGLLVFVWAISVMPNDMLIIPLAMTRYEVKRIVLPLFSGKFLHNIVIATVFYYSTNWSAAHVSTSVQADFALGILILFVMGILYQAEKVHITQPSMI